MGGVHGWRGASDQRSICAARIVKLGLHLRPLISPSPAHPPRVCTPPFHLCQFGEFVGTSCSRHASACAQSGARSFLRVVGSALCILCSAYCAVPWHRRRTRATCVLSLAPSWRSQHGTRHAHSGLLAAPRHSLTRQIRW